MEGKSLRSFFAGQVMTGAAVVPGVMVGASLSCTASTGAAIRSLSGRGDRCFAGLDRQIRGGMAAEAVLLSGLGTVAAMGVAYAVRQKLSSDNEKEESACLKDVRLVFRCAKQSPNEEESRNHLLGSAPSAPGREAHVEVGQPTL